MKKLAKFLMLALIIPCALFFSACTFSIKLYEKEGDYIYFGEYPQTIKAENVTVSKKPDKNGYYKGSDGHKYVKLKSVKSSSVENTGLMSDGSSIVAGEYYYFKVEPIKWRILKTDKDTAILITDVAIDVVDWQISFNQIGGDWYSNDSDAPENTYANNYKYSHIRKFLNKNFYNNFTLLEKAIIKKSVVDNSAATTISPEQNDYVCENTNDYVYIPSFIDLYNEDYGFDSQLGINPQTGFPYQNSQRAFMVTDYAKAKGCITLTQELIELYIQQTPAMQVLEQDWLVGSAAVWTRSPYGEDSMCVSGLHIGFAYDNVEVDYGEFGITPMMKIKL